MELVRSMLLVAEDENLIQQVSNQFSKHNYSVVIENSKIKSILKMLQQNIDLIMIDIDVTVNLNLDLIDIIRRTRPRLPIVVLSSDGTIDTLRKYIQAGVFYCALKPLDADEIVKLLEAVSHVNKLRGKMRDSFYDHYETKKLMYG